MTQFILTIASSSLVTFVLSLFAFKYDLLKIKATSSQEVSKSDQEKIATAEKTIELVDKLRARMDIEFESMTKQITSLKRELELYKNQCSKCSNNKIGKS